MTTTHSKLYAGMPHHTSLFSPCSLRLTMRLAADVSLVVVVVDTNPFFWAGAALPFADFFSHVRAAKLRKP
jgi:hypothetical protein